MKQEISSFWYTPRGYKGIGLMELLSIKSFKARHKPLNNDNNKSFIPKENQSYNPYGNEVKNNNNEKYIEIGDDDESLPF
ncbi:hypothetical protein DUZ08_00500 [Campylobacter jejuni]|nr:hypothetical protein [Campylobacter jejuni]EAL7639046.1 hypothetical protein [Campylobacter jejuni]